jgi:hypothetical protein
MAISSTAHAGQGKSKDGTFYGYLPPQLLHQIEEQTGYIQSKITGATTPNVSPRQRHSDADESGDGPKRKWAYAFLMAGVDVKSPGYRGILYNVLVSAEFLKDSVADVILMVQMAKDSKSDRLLPIEEHWLRAMNVTIKYLDLPKHGQQNFYTVQLEKFKILQWHEEYSRVIFMDGDVMPFCSLDYLFELSELPITTTSSGKAAIHEEPLLMQNLIIAWTLEPAHGGFFMLAPKKGDFEQLEEIIHGREQQVLDTGLILDEKIGWGHKIEERGWRATMMTRTNQHLWDWHGDFVDQGLLYYWTKYYKKDVSIVILDEVENWSSLPAHEMTAEQRTNLTVFGNLTNHTHDRQIYLDRILLHPFDAYTCVQGRDYPRLPRYSQRHTGSRGEAWHAPHRDFIHFTGKFKPWLPDVQKELDLVDILSRVKRNNTNSHTEVLDALKSPQELWFYTFWKIHTRLHMGSNTLMPPFGPANNITKMQQEGKDVFTKINIHHLDIPKLSLGGYPTYNMLKDVITARTGKSTSHVEGWTEIENRKKAQRKHWKTKASLARAQAYSHLQ